MTRVILYNFRAWCFACDTLSPILCWIDLCCPLAYLKFESMRTSYSFIYLISSTNLCQYVYSVHSKKFQWFVCGFTLSFPFQRSHFECTSINASTGRASQYVCYKWMYVGLHPDRTRLHPGKKMLYAAIHKKHSYIQSQDSRVCSTGSPASIRVSPRTVRGSVFAYSCVKHFLASTTPK